MPDERYFLSALIWVVGPSTDERETRSIILAVVRLDAANPNFRRRGNMGHACRVSVTWVRNTNHRRYPCSSDQPSFFQAHIANWDPTSGQSLLCPRHYSALIVHLFVDRASDSRRCSHWHMAVTYHWLPYFPILVRVTGGSLQTQVHDPYRPPRKSENAG